MTNDNRTSLKANHGAHNHAQAGKRGLLLRLTIFMAWVAGIGLLLSLVTRKPASAKQIATNDNSGYYIDLSKLISGLPSRTSLAFFVPDICIASQAKQDNSTALIHLPAYRKHGGNTVYDGLTLQNKIAERRICGAVSNKTESKTRHPILLPYSVAFTQNLLGVIHHG